jgi:hypothetical protein
MNTQKTINPCNTIYCLNFCAKDDFEEIDGVCPIVENTTQQLETLNVPIDQVITATFNEEMNAETINGLHLP